jgi:hypothetical protein
MAATMSIVSIQHATVTIPASSASATANLSGHTSLANCVPYKTTRISDTPTPADNWTETTVDVSFLTGPDRVQCSTAGSTLDRAVVVELCIVEYDGTNDIVRSGDVTDNSVSFTDTISPSLSNLTNAYLMFHYNTTGSQWHKVHSLRGWINSTSQVSFHCLGASTKTVHWWIVQNTGSGSFTTQDVGGATGITLINGDSTENATISSIATNRTFLVGSFEGGANASNQDDNLHSTLDIKLANATTITVTRKGTQDPITWSGYAVTLGWDSVQRGTISNNSSGNPTVNLTTGGYHSVDPDTSMAIVAGNMRSHSSGCFSGTDSEDGSDCYCAFTFEDSGATLRMQRNTAGADNTNDISWEIVEWDTGGEPPARRVFVVT